MSKDEISSHTVALYPLFILFCIYSHEKNRGIFDVLSAYLNAYMSEDTYLLIKLDNKFVDTMCMTNPELVINIRFEIGRK